MQRNNGIKNVKYVSFSSRSFFFSQISLFLVRSAETCLSSQVDSCSVLRDRSN